MVCEIKPDKVRVTIEPELLAESPKTFQKEGWKAD